MSRFVLRVGIGAFQTFLMQNKIALHLVRCPDCWLFVISSIMFPRNYNAYHTEYYDTGAPVGAPVGAPPAYVPVRGPAAYVPSRGAPPHARGPAAYVPARAPVRAPARAPPAAAVYRPRYRPAPATYKPAYKPAVYKPVYAPAPARQQRPVAPAVAKLPDHYHPHHHGPAVYTGPTVYKTQKPTVPRRPQYAPAGAPPPYHGSPFDVRSPAFFARIQEKDAEDAVDLFDDIFQDKVDKVQEEEEDPDAQVEKIGKLVQENSKSRS